MPTTVFLTSDGTIFEVHTGILDEATLREKCEVSTGGRQINRRPFPDTAPSKNPAMSGPQYGQPERLPLSMAGMTDGNPRSRFQLRTWSQSRCQNLNRSTHTPLAPATSSLLPGY